MKPPLWLLAVHAAMLLSGVACRPVTNDSLPTDPLLVDADGDGVVPEDGDCDDTRPEISPAAAERCNGIDDNCDEVVDEGFDLDADGFFACELPEIPLDCDDTDPQINTDAEEVCDGADNNCDARIDEGFDQDQDGVVSCELEGVEADCDDEDPERSPDLTERCDAIDNDCDEDIDEGFDDDRDGYVVCGGKADCDDDDDEVHPDQDEECNGRDDNCDGEEDEGFDEDGDGFLTCAVSGQSADCDDDDADVKPGARESCDGVDNNCNGATDEGFDQDGDGFRVCASQGKPADCDDGDGQIFPGQVELCDGQDQDCDGSEDDGLDQDEDEDGYLACDFGGEPDCDDEDPAISPGAQEVCNGADDNCDGARDEGFDQDEDTFTTCGGEGVEPDCDDLSAAVNPAAPEQCNDLDDDCDGQLDEDFDADGDGFTTCGSLGRLEDCDDGRAGIHPEAEELCNGLDDNCEGGIDEGFDGDADGFTLCGAGGEPDCDDEDPGVFPGNPVESCDGRDEDCSGGDGDLYVTPDGSSEGDHHSVIDALLAAQEGCVVVVAPGTYTGKLDFGGKQVTVRSEAGPAETILSGGGTTAVAVFLRGEGPGAVLEGFTLTGGAGESSVLGIPAGGAVFIGEGAGPVLRSNIIVGNRAQGGGGVICYGCEGATLEDNILQDNTAYRVLNNNGLGGGFYGQNCQGLVFRDNAWIGNHADHETGGAKFIQCEVTVEGDLFDSNVAAGVIGLGRGGAIMVDTGEATLRGVHITGNSALVGGGLYALSASLVMEDCAVETNTTVVASGDDDNTGDGGGMVIDASTLTLKRSRLVGNEAVKDTDRDDSGGFGGAILTRNSSSGSIEQCLFKGNVASGWSGGGVYLLAGTWLVRNNIFSGNRASFGGALYLQLLTADSEVTNNTLVDNAATSAGGAVYMNASAMLLYNNIFAYTTGRTALYFYATIAQTYVASSVQYNNFYQNAAGNYSGNMTDPVGVFGNLALDPQFVGYSTGDLHLQSSSPLQDAGNPDVEWIDPDGTRNQIGAFGGPGASWDPTLIGSL